MKFKRKVVDLDTGDTCWTDLGDHRPFTEVALSLGIGPRKFREVLLAMGLVSREMDIAGSRFRTTESPSNYIPSGAKFRHRLTPWAVESGFGYRIDNVGFAFDANNTPFDVLSPLGVEYVRDHLREALATISAPSKAIKAATDDLTNFEADRRAPLDNHGRTLWIDDYHPDLPARDIATALGITERLVRRYRADRDRQRMALREHVRASNGACAALLTPRTVIPESEQGLAA